MGGGWNEEEGEPNGTFPRRSPPPQWFLFMLMLIKKNTSKHDDSQELLQHRCSLVSALVEAVLSARWKPWHHQEVRSAGGAAVVGHILQAAQQRRVVVGTNPFGWRLILQRHAALPGGSFSGPDHAVDLLEALRGQRSQGQPAWKDRTCLRLSLWREDLLWRIRCDDRKRVLGFFACLVFHDAFTRRLSSSQPSAESFQRRSRSQKTLQFTTRMNYGLRSCSPQILHFVGSNYFLLAVIMCLILWLNAVNKVWMFNLGDFMFLAKCQKSVWHHTTKPLHGNRPFGFIPANRHRCLFLSCYL